MLSRAEFMARKQSCAHERVEFLCIRIRVSRARAQMQFKARTGACKRVVEIRTSVLEQDGQPSATDTLAVLQEHATGCFAPLLRPIGTALVLNRVVRVEYVVHLGNRAGTSIIGKSGAALGCTAARIGSRRVHSAHREIVVNSF